MKNNNTNNENMKNFPSYRSDNAPNSTPGVNNPEIDLPLFNPPVPNRAWTAMRAGLDIDELSEEEKRDLYIGNDGIM